MSRPPVSGRTGWIAHLGEPIERAGLPRLLAPLLDERELDIAVAPVAVVPAGLAALVGGLRQWRNLVGFTVTHPHKEAMPMLLDSVDEQASQIGAVNLVRRDRDGSLHGCMVDGAGFLAGLREHDHDPAGRRVLLLGAGGTARAIAFALGGAGVASLRVANRTTARAERLVADLRAACPGLEVEVGAPAVGEAELIVNATSLGMRTDDPLPIELAGVAPSTVVADVVLGSGLDGSDLVLAARRAGLPAHPGERMLVAQLPLMLSRLGLA